VTSLISQEISQDSKAPEPEAEARSGAEAEGRLGAEVEARPGAEPEASPGAEPDTKPSSTVAELGRRAKVAAPQVATASTSVKNRALLLGAERLLQHSEEILRANASDIEASRKAGISETLVDRLRLNPARLKAMAKGLEAVAGLPDPVGEIVAGSLRPNGLRVEQVRSPLGVVAIIYESRPNVTSDAAGLCVKSGNVAFLRGSSMAVRSNIAIAGVLRQALAEVGLPADALLLVEDTSREAAVEFMQLTDVIDCLIPRGGHGLIASVLENATVPYIIDGDGNCHVYVDSSADLAMARQIIVNAKIQRPSVCNAAESLLVHRAVADQFLPQAVADLEGVELVGDAAACRLAPSIQPAEPGDFGREFLDLKLSVCVVDNLEAAIDHINQHGTGHSEAIVTSDYAAAERFVAAVDAAVVFVNASTRFADGEELGYGAEIGISTQKLHARGPMGLTQLTATRYVVRGDGQIRG